MPTPRQLKIAVYSFGYGGNGGIKSQHPDVSQWLLGTLPQAAKDERISNIVYADMADTPITMCRNQAVLEARDVGADVCVMIDSDMQPDMDLGQPDVVPFWDTAFDFIYNNYDKGPHVVAAPYGGGPPHENVFVFQWTNQQSDHFDDADLNLSQYTREQAFQMAGIQPCAALPTGLIMYDMRVFELTEPKDATETPWFYYEWGSKEVPAKYAASKASTEDVTATRDMSLAGVIQLGYNPVHVAWSSWAGHWKPKCVGRPRLINSDFVGKKFTRIVRDRLPSHISRQVVDFPVPSALPHHGNGREREPGHPQSHRRWDSNQDVLDEQAIEELLIHTLEKGVPGDVVELGCNKGLTSVALQKIMALLSPNKQLHVYDSFQGMPEWTEEDKGTKAGIERGKLRVGPQDVRNNFLKAELSMPVIHEGWVKDVLPHELPEQIVFALIDVDLYEPTLACLCAVYDRLAPDAICIIHDYENTNITGAKKAVDEFFKERYGVAVRNSGCTSVYFKKPLKAIQDNESEGVAIDSVVVGNVTYNLQNIQDENAIDELLQTVLDAGIPGDVVELGCNAGNTSVRMAKVMGGECDKAHHVFDSFQGMPEWTKEDEGTDEFMLPGSVKVSPRDVQNNFASNNLPQPVIHEGWLKDTLPHELPEQIAFAFIDVDLYEPTLACLCAVYDRLAPGAICMIHDYISENITGTKIAVDEFFKERYGVPVTKAGCTSVYFIKPQPQAEEASHDEAAIESDSADSGDAGAGNRTLAQTVQ